MSEEKKFSSHRKQYAVLSRETIRVFAEAGGHGEDLPDELASLLSEEVVYRLRELTQISCQFMRHAKRRKLTAEDFNRALRQSDCQAVFGHGAPESVQWRQTREGDINFVEDIDTGLANLACSSQAPHALGATTLRAHWLAVEGSQKSVSIPQPASGAPSSKPLPALSEYLQHHYDLLTKAVLASNPELTQVALDDLRKSTRIAPLLPNMVNFITNGIRKLNHDTRCLLNMLYTVDCLLQNPTIFLESQPYMSVLVDCVRHCAVEPLGMPARQPSDQWKMRDYAARLLASMIHEWNSPVNRLQQQVTQGLSKLLGDPGKPFCTHYGAICILTALGHQCFEEAVMPHLATLWPHLQATLDDTSITNAQLKMDATKVYGALQAGAGSLNHARRASLLQQHEAQCLLGPADTIPSSTQPDALLELEGEVELLQSQPPEEAATAAQLYSQSYYYLGDSVAATLPVVCLKDVYKPRPPQEVSLADEDSKKSGQELLQQFLPVPGTLPRGRRGLDMEELEFRSYDPDPDDMDLDYDMEEKSEHSSERSHSEENFFLGEDVGDLTVKATVSDPSKGIKLFIAKKPKSKTSEAESQDSGSEHVKTPPRLTQEIPKKPKAKPSYEDLFEPSAIKSREITFVFRYAGRIQRCKSIERRKSVLVEPRPIVGPVVTDTEYQRLCRGLGPRGKMRQPWNSEPARLRRRRRAHYMCSLDTAFL